MQRRRARNLLTFAVSIIALTLITPAGRAVARSGEKTVEAERSQADESVQPVYPIKVKPHPRAEKLCGLLHDLPARRRGECCGRPPGATLSSECVRMLSAAIRSGAVTLEERDLTTCVDAMEKAYAGCDWVGPNPPDPPASCAGIIHGMLVSGAICRSTLECAGGLRCFGVGPTATGVCGKPKRDGSPCGKVEDPLLLYARQESVEAERGECTGFCDRGRCRVASDPGAACTRNEPCGVGKRCAGGACVEGATAREGEKCMGSVCTPGLRCLGGVCAKPKGPGQFCQADVECLGACVRPGGSAPGSCGKRCDGSPMEREKPPGRLRPGG